jgi:AbrB family looped-hinge helix DNA binding protein
MSEVTVSNKYQVVIPKKVVKELGAEPGTAFTLVRSGKILKLIPIVPIESLAGTLPDLDATIEREGHGYMDAGQPF